MVTGFIGEGSQPPSPLFGRKSLPIDLFLFCTGHKQIWAATNTRFPFLYAFFTPRPARRHLDVSFQRANETLSREVVADVARIPQIRVRDLAEMPAAAGLFLPGVPYMAELAWPHPPVADSLRELLLDKQRDLVSWELPF